MPEPIDIAGSSSTPLLGGTITPMPHALTITREQWRRYLAGQALAGILANQVSRDITYRTAINDAVTYAAGLIAELERTEP